MDSPSLLRHVPRFAGCSEDARVRLASPCVARTYGAGHLLFSTGDPCRGLYIVETGRVRIIRTSAGGREQVLHTEGPCRPVAELPLLDGGAYPSSTPLHHAGIALIGIGILLRVGNIGSTLPRSKSRDVTWVAVAIALCCLTCTLVPAAVLPHSLHTGFLAETRIRVPAVHLHVALVGWALVMMVGVSHGALALFLLAHGAEKRFPKVSLALLSVGVLTLGIGLTRPGNEVAWAGTVLLLAGIACFLAQGLAFYRVRVRRKTEVGMRVALMALAFLASAALLGPFVFARGIAHPRLGTA